MGDVPERGIIQCHQMGNILYAVFTVHIQRSDGRQEGQAAIRIHNLKGETFQMDSGYN